MATTPKEAAWEAAHRGWKIFPLRTTASGKLIPAIKDWENTATSQLAKIEAWQERFPGTQAWGLACSPSGLFALDIDRKSGKNPDRVLDTLPLLPPTFVVKTPTGGEHYVYSGQGPSTVQALGEGLDTRGRGGYIVLYGSIRSDGRYEIIEERQPSIAPPWLVEACEKSTALRAVLPEGVSIMADAPASLAIAEDWISSAPPAIEGDSGDLRTYQTACRLRDLGVSATKAVELMLTHYNPRCSPPWDNDELAAKVANAYRYAKNAPGVASPEAFFGKVDVVRNPLTLIDAQNWADEEPPPIDPVLDGIFDCQDKVAIIGPSKTRKTFFSLQLCMALASGHPFMGFTTPKARRVLLINAEVTPRHFHRRVKRVYNGFFSMFDPVYHPLGNRLMIHNSRGTKLTDDSIAAMAEDSEAEIILLDPLYKLLMGDECDQERVSILLARFDALATKTGAAVIYVHHDGKGAVGDKATRDRGSGSSLLNRDFDACFALSPHADNDDEAVLSVLLRNYAPVSDIGMKFQDGVWLYDSTVTIRPETAASRKEKNHEVWTPEALLPQALALITQPISVGELLPKLQTMAGGRNKGRELLELLKANPSLDVSREKTIHARVIISPRFI